MHTIYVKDSKRDRKVPKLTKGFSFIELLVVVVIISVLSIPFVINYKTTRNTQVLNAAAEVLGDRIRNAHVFAREANEKKGWGIVRDSETRYLLVSGEKDDWSTQSSYSLQSGVTIPDVFFIWFEKGTGETENLQTISIVNRSGKTIQVVVQKTGLVEVDP